MECKLRDIAKEPKVLREEQLQKCVFGQNAFILDDNPNGTTIFVPWRLHKPLEKVFQKYSDSEVMHMDQFLLLVDEATLFPKFQNHRKKEDIVNFILDRTNKKEQGLLFEDFLFALNLLARYRASVFHVTEQSSFNHLLSSLTNFTLDLDKDDATLDTSVSEKADSTDQSDSVHRSISINQSDSVHHSISIHKSDSVNQSASPSIAPLSRTATILSRLSSRISEALGKVEQSSTDLLETATETRDAEPATEDVGVQATRISRSVSWDSFSIYKSMEKDISELIKALNESGIHAENRNLQERLNEEMELRRNLQEESINKQRELEGELLEAKREMLSKESSVYNLERTTNDLKAELDRLGRTKEELENRLNATISELENKVGELNKELEHHKTKEKLKQEMHEKLVLDSEDEVKLFSIFCVYKDEPPIDGEFVLSEDSCISFCLDFGLGDPDSPKGTNEPPKAKQAYDKVSGLSINGSLTYLLFKEFLMQLSLLFKPGLSPQEGFKFIVYDLLLRYLSDSSRPEEVKGTHLVDTRVNDPWSAAEFGSAYTPQITNFDRFMDVEGKVWFEEPKGEEKDDKTHTPRF